ncbi:hypothetical protein EVG20_g3413 [Dentipellis fragilis]|uniref:Uncharacterized protein n=1 Tax=Dentipellis fragilis TaxID=205917 RepID=A0A4Y9Z2C5_9AGAM|nr:hypothetical protein EVG20_g3413 [Dentipellis fragilis]
MRLASIGVLAEQWTPDTDAGYLKGIRVWPSLVVETKTELAEQRYHRRRRLDVLIIYRYVGEEAYNSAKAGEE